MIKQDEYRRRISEKIKRELGRDICALLDDPAVSEIMLNPSGELWVERLAQPIELIGHMDAPQAESLIGTIASNIQEAVTATKPNLECELPLDGSRFSALIPPIVEGPAFTIRKRAIMVFTLQDYVNQGIMTTSQRVAIEDAVRNKKNILVVGGTGSGKTTLTNAVIRCMADFTPHERLVIMEDTRELQSFSRNVVPMRSSDDFNMAQLLKATLRFRPDRILVGEVRDGAAWSLLQAWNTGHPGGIATVHGNSA